MTTAGASVAGSLGAVDERGGVLAAEPGDVARAVHPVPSASFGTRRWLC